MRITILAHGTRGDVQPYIALGQGLQRAGHQVRLAAPALFADFVHSYGLEFAPLSGDPTQLMHQAVTRAGKGLNPVSMGRVVFDYVMPIAGQVLAEARQACADAEAVIHTLLTVLVGHEIALQQQIPDFSALVFAIFASTDAFPNQLFPAWKLGRRYNRLSHQMFELGYWHAARLGYHYLRRRQPLDLPLTEWPFAPGARPTPRLYGFSPQVLPIPPEAGPHVHVTGYWFLEAPAGWQPPPGLEAFLASGPPPVFVGFGSIVNQEARRVTDIVLEALRRTGWRAVLLSGWGGLAAERLPANVFPVESVPYDWLFPRLAGAVHHGGIGTTAAAFKAGIPSLVVPFTADQPFWARRVFELGAGPRPIPHRRLTVARLADGLVALREDLGIRQRAETLGAQVQSEDGVSTAVRILENYWNTTGGGTEIP